MTQWLVKSEPVKFSWDDMKKAGTTHWDGVRNPQAAMYLRAMQAGDLAFFYHSNEGKEIVGVVKIVREAYPDPSDETGRYVMVDVAYHKPLKKPVTLATIKSMPELSDIGLVRQSRLSVMPITDAHWNILTALGGL